MKKRILAARNQIAALALTLCLMLASAFPLTMGVKAASAPGQLPQEYLDQTLKAMGYFPENYVESPTYSHEFAVNGYEYLFTADGEQCYALLLSKQDENGNYVYDVTEIFFGTPSAFATATGTKIYVDQFTYIEYRDGKFYDLESGAELSADAVRQIAENGFYGESYSSSTSTTEEISYADKSISTYQFKYGLPNYEYSNHENSCANIAGAIILAYYDIFFPQLIPNYEPLDSNNSYKKINPNILSITDELYHSMGTNTNNGTTLDGFRTGLTKYVNDKGYTVTYNDIKRTGSFNFDTYRAQINQDRPVVLFLSYYNVSVGACEINDNTDILSLSYYNTKHVMVGCGYEIINYYNSNGVKFRSDTYLRISPIKSDSFSGYMKINSNEKIDSAYAIDIF